jgi:hypothetical protein
MDEYLFNPIVQLTESHPNAPQIFNRHLRPVFRHTGVSFPNGPASAFFITGIPDTLDTCRHFTTPVYAVFSRGQRGLPIPPDDIQEIINVILSQNETLQGYLRDRLDSVL